MENTFLHKVWPWLSAERGSMGEVLRERAVRVEEILQGFLEEVGLGLHLESERAFLARGIHKQTHLACRVRVFKIT